jgi:hypothetical protein
MAEFVALYRGQTVGDAKLVALSAESRIVGLFFSELLGEPKSTEPSPTAGTEREDRILKPVPHETG